MNDKKNKDLINLPSDNLLKRHNVDEKQLAENNMIKSKRSNSHKIVFSILLAAIIIGVCAGGALIFAFSHTKIRNVPQWNPNNGGGGNNKHNNYSLNAKNFTEYKTGFGGPSEVLLLDLGSAENSSLGVLAPYSNFRVQMILNLSLYSKGKLYKVTANAGTGITSMNLINATFIRLPQENDKNQIASIHESVPLTNITPVNSKTKEIDENYQMGIFIYHGIPSGNSKHIVRNYLCLYVYLATGGDNSVTDINIPSNSTFTFYCWNN